MVQAVQRRTQVKIGLQLFQNRATRERIGSSSPTLIRPVRPRVTFIVAIFLTRRQAAGHSDVRVEVERLAFPCSSVKVTACGRRRDGRRSLVTIPFHLERRIASLWCGEVAVVPEHTLATIESGY